MSLENQVITKVLGVGLEPATNLGLRSSSFLQFQNVWDWIVEFASSTGELPKADTVTNKFPAFSLEPAPEALKYYVDELYWDNFKQASRDFVGDLSDAIKADDRRLAFELVSRYGRDALVRPDDIQDMVASDLLDKSTEFVESIYRDFIGGVPLGIERVDAEIGGAHPGEFCAFIAPTSSGKTWLILNAALAAARAGHQSLIFSCEMIPSRVWARLVALIYRLPAKRLRQGLLTAAEKSRLEDPVDLPGDIRVVHVASRTKHQTGIDLIRRKIYETSPSAVFIDAWYLLSSTSTYGTQDWQRLKALGEELRFLALETMVPIIVSHQATREGAKRRKGAQLTDVAGSWDLAGLLDIALFSVLTSELRAEKKLGIVARKAREFDPFSCTVHFDVNSGVPITVADNTWVTEKEIKDISTDDDDDLDPSRMF